MRALKVRWPLLALRMTIRRPSMKNVTRRIWRPRTVALNGL